jgi:hypothetical protein
MRLLRPWTEKYRFNAVTYSGFAWRIITGSGFDDKIFGTSLPITINYNSSHSMAFWDSLQSLLNYEYLLFSRDWLGSDLRIGHFFFSLVSTPQLNTQFLATVWRIPSTATLLRLLPFLALSCVPPFITSAEPNRDHHFQQFTLLHSYPLLPEPCVISVTTLWFHYSGFQAVLTEPLRSNSHIRHNTLPDKGRRTNFWNFIETMESVQIMCQFRNFLLPPLTSVFVHNWST